MVSVSHSIYTFISVCGVWEMYFFSYFVLTRFFLVFNQIKRGENEESRL